MRTDALVPAKLDSPDLKVCADTCTHQPAGMHHAPVFEYSSSSTSSSTCMLAAAGACRMLSG